MLLWDGKSSQLQETTLTIAGGKSTANASSVFCVRNGISDTQSYKTMMLSFDEDGNMDVEAIFFPTDENGKQ